MTSTKAPTSLESGNVGIVQEFVARFSAAWKRPNVDVVRGLMHADTRNLIPPMTQAADRESVLAHFAEVIKKVPDLSLDIRRWAHSGDTVMIEWNATATVRGNSLAWTGVDIMRLRGDKISELQSYWDTKKLSAKIETALLDGDASA